MQTWSTRNTRNTRNYSAFAFFSTSLTSLKSSDSVKKANFSLTSFNSLANKKKKTKRKTTDKVCDIDDNDPHHAGGPYQSIHITFRESERGWPVWLELTTKSNVILNV